MQLLAGSSLVRAGPALSLAESWLPMRPVPPECVLSIVGHLLPLPETGPAEWAEFREYTKRKYPNELDEDLITLIEDLIERRRGRNGSPSP